MAWPMLTPAPVVTAHAAVFRDLFENQCQFRPFPHDLTGLLVWPHKRLAHRARCLLDSADNTTLARLLAEAPWREEAVNRRRVRFMLQQTTPQRSRRRASLVVIDATRCDQVGSLVDAVDRPDHHRDGPYPLAHHPVTRVSVSGPVRCPLGRRLSRRDAELRPWEAAVATQVPELQIPTESTARNRRQTQVAPVLLQDPEGRARHEPWRTTSALALEWIAEAIRRQGPWGVVVFEAWYLAADVVQVLARRRQDWSSGLHTNRLLETASVHLQDAHGWTLKVPSPHLAAEELVPLIPATAYRPINVSADTSWGLTRTVRIPGVGQVRLVVSCEHASVTGRSVLLVTHRLDWGAAKMISLSSQRWPTATFDQASKGYLGCNEYRMRRAAAIGTHGCLVVVASALWPLTCLPAGPERTKGLIHTLGDACRQQGRAVLQRRLRFVPDPWSHGTTVAQVFTQFFAKQQGTVLV